MTVTHDLLTDHSGPDTQNPRVGEDPNTRNGQNQSDTQVMTAVAGLNDPDDQPPVDAQRTDVVGDLQQLNGHVQHDTHMRVAVEPLTPHPTITASISMGTASGGALDSGDHRHTDTQRTCVAAPTPPAPASPLTASKSASPVLADPLLALAADVLDDLERVRIANENRLRQLTRDTTDKDGEERGFGLTLDHPDVARLAALVNALTKAEHDATLNLQRMVRRHPLGPWIKQAKGVGEKQAARLLAAIGDPYWNELHNRPRRVSELWAFCGYSVHRLPAGSNPDHALRDAQASPVGVAVARQRGAKVNWSPTAKMRAFLVAESIVKAGGPYRQVYDDGRAKYADAVHQVECKRCGPAGKPAPTGSPLSAGHQHARALRLVAKTVLRDLWREARRIHEAPTERAT